MKICKILIVFILVMSMVLSMTACGEKTPAPLKPTTPTQTTEPSPSPTDTTEPETSPSPSPSPSPSETKKPVEIVWPSVGGGSNTWDKDSSITSGSYVYELSSADDSLTLSAPNFTGTMKIKGAITDDSNLTIDMPKATVEFEGKADTLNATTGMNSLHVKKGAEVKTLNVLGGNVVVEENVAKVEIKENSNTKTVVAKKEAVVAVKNLSTSAVVAIANEKAVVTIIATTTPTYVENNAETNVKTNTDEATGSSEVVVPTKSAIIVLKSNVVEKTEVTIPDNADKTVAFDGDADVIIPFGYTMTISPTDELNAGKTIANYGTIEVSNGSGLGIAVSFNGNVVLVDDVTTDMVVKSGKTVVLDLAGNKLTSAASHAITNNGNLTVNDSVGGGIVDGTIHAKAAIFNSSSASAVLNGGKFDRSLESGQSSSNNGGNSYYAVENCGTMTINDGVSVTQDGHYSSMIKSYSAIKSDNSAAVLLINGGTFSGGLNTVKNDANSKTTINGGTFTNVTQFVLQNWGTATINGGTFALAEEGAHAVIMNANYTKEVVGDEGDFGAVGNITLVGGAFDGDIILKAYGSNNLYGDDSKITIANDFVINEGQTFIVADGAILDIEGTLTNNGKIINNGTVTNNGKIINEGTITNEFAIINNGALTNNGEVVGNGQYIGDMSGLFFGGDGTKNDPYLIDSVDQLEYMNQNAEYNYYKVKDANQTWDGSNWDSIDNFRGSFDGNGLTMSNLSNSFFHHLNCSDESAVKVKDLTLDCNIIQSDTMVAGLAYSLDHNTIISNVDITGNISSTFAASYAIYALRNNFGTTNSEILFENCVSDVELSGGTLGAFTIIAKDLSTSGYSNGKMKIKDSIYKGISSAGSTTGYFTATTGTYYYPSVEVEYSDEFIAEHGVATTLDGEKVIAGYYHTLPNKENGYNSLQTFYLVDNSKTIKESVNDYVLGENFVVDAEEGATKAKAAFSIGANPGCLVNDYEYENLVLSSSKFETNSNGNICLWDIKVGTDIEAGQYSGELDSESKIYVIKGNEFTDLDWHSATVTIEQYDDMDKLLARTIFTWTPADIENLQG